MKSEHALIEQPIAWKTSSKPALTNITIAEHIATGKNDTVAALQATLGKTVADSRAASDDTLEQAYIALPLATFSVGGAVRREFAELRNLDVASLYGGTLDLRYQLAQEPQFATNETLREAHDRLELGRRALARVASDRLLMNGESLDREATPLLSARAQLLADYVRQPTRTQRVPPVLTSTPAVAGRRQGEAR
jgi:hypothetical protein